MIEPKLEALERAEPPAAAPEERGAVWLATGPVIQVKFKQRTPDGSLRQPTFMRVREDKSAAQCVWPAVAESAGDSEPVADASSEADPPASAGPPRTVDLTNLDKVFWPADGYTKGDMIEYYRGISDWLLPYLRDRPVVLTRFPDGIDGKSFFQKDAPVYAPKWLRLETMWSEQAEREIRYFVLDDVESLVYVANMGSIPLHVWSSRVAALERPDWCILDLDPKGAPLTDVVKIARHIHDLCEDVGLVNYVKTSGSTGLHVLIPLGAQVHVRAFAHARRAHRALHGEVAAGDLDDRTQAERSRRKGLPRLSAERPWPAARRAVQRAAAAAGARVDAARVEGGDGAAQARALQHQDGAQADARARRSARGSAHRVDRHARGDRRAAAPAREVARRARAALGLRRLFEAPYSLLCRATSRL